MRRSIYYLTLRVQLINQYSGCLHLIPFRRRHTITAKSIRIFRPRAVKCEFRHATFSKSNRLNWHFDIVKSVNYPRIPATYIHLLKVAGNRQQRQRTKIKTIKLYANFFIDIERNYFFITFSNIIIKIIDTFLCIVRETDYDRPLIFIFRFRWRRGIFLPIFRR